MLLDDPLFSLVQTAAAAGVPVNTIRSWKHRGQLRLAGEDIEGEAGLPHRLSLRTALHIGTVGALVKLGIDAKRADEAAAAWTHVGNGPDQPSRDPAELYAEPMTVLCCYADAFAEVKHMPLKGAGAHPLFVSIEGGQQAGAVILILDHVDKRVRTALFGCEEAP